jgi:hypothetical protein
MLQIQHITELLRCTSASTGCLGVVVLRSTNVTLPVLLQWQQSKQSFFTKTKRRDINFLTIPN